MEKILATMFLLILCNLSQAQQIPDLTNWKLDAFPVGDSLNTANHSPNNWVFIEKDGRWLIEQNTYKQERGDRFPFTMDFIDKNLKELKGKRSVKKTPDGFLVGVNKGEFGGGLYFVENDGLNGYEMGKFLNIRLIFEYNARYFSLEGLSHLSVQRGQIIEIYKEDKFWKYKPLTQLIEAPALIADYNKEKIILTSQHILKFGQDFKVTEILKSPFYWGVLYPSSMIVDNNDVYIAMRKGILKIKAFDTSPEYEWYIPRQ